MSRPLRIEFPGAVYHLTARGNARAPIFRTDGDHDSFLSTLAHVVDREGWSCHAYCLMPNHYHLLVETARPTLVAGMRQLNGAYSQAFNGRHTRTGHLFQGRYKAILVQKEAHLLELCRYVVLNPVRARLCARVEDAAWTSYRATIGKAPRPTFLTVDWILGQFEATTAAARLAFRQFVAEGFEDRPLLALDGMVNLGDAQHVPKGALSNVAAAEVPTRQRMPFRPPLAEIFREDEQGIVLARKNGYSLREIAVYIGVHYSTVSRRLRALELGVEAELDAGGREPSDASMQDLTPRPPLGSALWAWRAAPS